MTNAQGDADEREKQHHASSGHAAAYQKVRSCQRQWLSSQVPRALSRVT